MVECIECNLRVTLSEIVAELSSQHGVDISEVTVNRHLDFLTYSLKRIRFEPVRANMMVKKLKRKEFVESLLQYQSTNTPIVFMDETNLNSYFAI